MNDFSGPLTCWRTIPIFRGIGLNMNIVNIFGNLVYNMMIAYSLYYLFLSFRGRLPWQSCDPAWKSPSWISSFFFLWKAPNRSNYFSSEFFYVFILIKTKDCVDDYRPESFKFVTCDDLNNTLKCFDDGKCYNLTAKDGSLASCSLNSSQL